MIFKVGPSRIGIGLDTEAISGHLSLTKNKPSLSYVYKVGWRPVPVKNGFHRLKQK